MNSLVQVKMIALLFRSLVVLTALFCSPLSPMAQAVAPPPDGGYPGGNTAEGQNALLSLTTGGVNTAGGFLSLTTNTVRSCDTAVGAGILLSHPADQDTALGN